MGYRKITRKEKQKYELGGTDKYILLFTEEELLNYLEECKPDPLEFIEESFVPNQYRSIQVSTNKVLSKSTIAVAKNDEIRFIVKRGDQDFELLGHIIKYTSNFYIEVRSIGGQIYITDKEHITQNVSRTEFKFSENGAVEERKNIKIVVDDLDEFTEEIEETEV